MVMMTSRMCSGDEEKQTGRKKGKLEGNFAIEVTQKDG
jgi:hypothetical protein